MSEKTNATTQKLTMNILNPLNPNNAFDALSLQDSSPTPVTECSNCDDMNWLWPFMFVAVAIIYAIYFIVSERIASKDNARGNELA